MIKWGLRIPTIMDFDKYQSIDILRIFDKLGSYYNFLKKYEKNYNVKLNEKEALFIEFISKKLAAGKRPHELILIKLLIEDKKNIMSNLESKLKERYNINFTNSTEKNLINILTNEFPTGTGKKTYEQCIVE